LALKHFTNLFSFKDKPNFPYATSFILRRGMLHQSPTN